MCFLTEVKCAGQCSAIKVRAKSLNGLLRRPIFLDLFEDKSMIITDIPLKCLVLSSNLSPHQED